METILSSAKSSKNKKKYIIITVISLLVITIGVVAGIILMGKRQLVEQKASIPEGTAKVYIKPESKTIEGEETFTSTVLFDSGGIAISALTVQLEYTYQGSAPPISATDIQINSILSTDNSWDFPTKSINKSGGKVIIRIGGYNSSQDGYITSGEEELATINFKGDSPGSINVQFNPTESKITKKSDGTDTLLIPESTGRYNVSGSTTQTPTPTPTPTPGEESETPTPTPTPDGGDKTGTSSGSGELINSTSTPAPIPETGASAPAIVGMGLGAILIMGAVILAI